MFLKPRSSFAKPISNLISTSLAWIAAPSISAYAIVSDPLPSKVLIFLSPAWSATTFSVSAPEPSNFSVTVDLSDNVIVSVVTPLTVSDVPVPRTFSKAFPEPSIPLSFSVITPVADVSFACAVPSTLITVSTVPERVATLLTIVKVCSDTMSLPLASVSSFTTFVITSLAVLNVVSSLPVACVKTLTSFVPSVRVMSRVITPLLRAYVPVAASVSTSVLVASPRTIL